MLFRSMIFLDVEMPEMDGIKAAKEIRKIDETACLIFVTSIMKYAINVYEVNALDFMLKPVEYFTFADKFQKALAYQQTRREKYAQLIDDDKSITRIAYSEIYYLEKERNYIVYHTSNGDFRERGTIASKEEDFLKCGFAKCSSGCLVNMRHVLKTKKNTVWVANGAPLGVKQEEVALPISRQFQKEFVNELMKYWGGMGA